MNQKARPVNLLEQELPYPFGDALPADALTLPRFAAGTPASGSCITTTATA